MRSFVILSVLLTIPILCAYAGPVAPPNPVPASQVAQSAQPATPPAKAEIDAVKKDLNSKIERLEHDVKMLRQTQINYKIEKEALKEVYSSSLQGAQVILVVVMGVLTVLVGTFTALGIKGWRDIVTIKGNFEKDLEDFRTKKTESEEEMRGFKQHLVLKLEESEQAAATAACRHQ